MQDKLRQTLLRKTDLCAPKLCERYEGAFLGYSLFQPHHHLPSPVYSIHLMARIDNVKGAVDSKEYKEYVRRLYADYVKGRDKSKAFAPVFVAEVPTGREEVLSDD